MMSRSPFVLLLLLALVKLAGCAVSGSPDYDSRFGDAQRALMAQQLIDPDAPRRNAGVVAEGDGRTVLEAGLRHTESYKAPPPTNIINIGVGAGGNAR